MKVTTFPSTTKRIAKKAPNPQQQQRMPTLEQLDMNKPELHTGGPHLFWITFTERVGASSLVRRIVLRKDEHTEASQSRKAFNVVLQRIKENQPWRIIS